MSTALIAETFALSTTEMANPVFTSVVTEGPSHLEHIFQDGSLVACIYQTIDGRYKFSCRGKLIPTRDYSSLAEAKHDLCQVLIFDQKLASDPAI